MNVTEAYRWQVNTDSGNGLLPDGNKPLPQPIVTHISCHMALLCHNKLIENPKLIGWHSYTEMGPWIVYNTKWHNFSFLLKITMAVALLFSNQHGHLHRTLATNHSHNIQVHHRKVTSLSRERMAQCKTAVSPLHQQWRYCSLALSHR